ncbi:cobalt-precorrin-6A reductase [Arsenicitalea aurantiaca]|uniref:Cobalt-precorrin-6A reductase n=1 Tax=Arsenicitalea aurantiaca TaxID=1783274 RepID=A0A433X3Z0_9HYPH|nr:cobalt-precorrin-6A reductase [Arsenicitalea aurantiaca]RUT28779.1 cobalt-precorrin-6A reductase [Arsenicitalea aurantiaca]
MKILILGGTGDARELADRLVEMGHDVTTSLAGRTENPVLPKGAIRIGGFGGADFLAAFLRAEGFERLVDATHPYAARISRNAVTAADAAGIPLVRVVRPGWAEPKYAFWHHQPDFETAAARLPRGARALLTIGHAGLDPFLARTDCTFLVRSIEAPAELLPANAWSILSRPPHFLPEEIALMKAEKISHLVTKNSGGAATEAKLKAAEHLRVAVFMIARPALPEAIEVQSLGRAIAALHLTSP